MTANNKTPTRGRTFVGAQGEVTPPNDAPSAPLSKEKSAEWLSLCQRHYAARAEAVAAGANRWDLIKLARAQREEQQRFLKRGGG